MTMTTEPVVAERALSQPAVASRRRVALFTSVDSFEAFYGGTFGLDRTAYLTTYRNDFVWEYSEGLRQNGHDVVIYVLSRGPSALHAISPGLGVRFIHLDRWLRAVDPVLWRLRKIRRAAALRDSVSYRAYGRALQAALIDDRIDILYHQEIWTPRFDTIVRHSPIPVVGAEHGAVYEDWMEPAKRASFAAAAQLVCQSLGNLERASTFGGKAELMYNSIDSDFFRPVEAQALRPKTILAVGRLDEGQKRFADLLNALRLLPDYTLTLVGSGPDEARLKKLAVDLRVAERVHFAGFISDRKALRTLYQECGVFVSTSSWEAVALVVLEAMSCEAPVVVTRIPSFEELLTDGEDGLLVPVGAPEQVASAVQRAHADQRELGAKARQTVVAGYSARVLYKRLSDLIETVPVSA